MRIEVSIQKLLAGVTGVHRRRCPSAINKADDTFTVDSQRNRLPELHLTEPILLYCSVRPGRQYTV